jgi:tetratricopeptide (TPR) repeat protein
VLVGCASQNSSPIKNLDANTAESMNADHSRFERSDDPPINIQTRYAAAQLAESQGNTVQAIKLYRQVLAENPKHQAALYRLGIIYTEIKQYPLAIEVWRQYVKANDGSATAISNLGFCYELSGDLPEAEKAYNIGIAKEPTNQSCRVNYGLMLVRQNRIPEATEQLSAVLRPAEVHYNIGSVYEQQGQKDLAKAEYKKATEIDPKFWEANARMAALQ